VTDEQKPDSDIHALPILAMVLGALATGFGAFDVFIERDGGLTGVAIMAAGAIVVLIGALADRRK
jgi:hypothetical protein